MLQYFNLLKINALRKLLFWLIVIVTFSPLLGCNDEQTAITPNSSDYFEIQQEYSEPVLDFKIENPIPAKMPMHVVFPRPDTETQTHARHRWAHPQMRYEIPIGVQGGAWPFKYELLQAPIGAQVGQTLGEHNYGIVTWTPLTNSHQEYTFKVRVIDQFLDTVELVWQVSVDPNQFVFIQDGWRGERIGTISEPLAEFSDWYKGDRNNSDFHNKIVVFREGHYDLLGDANANNNVRLDAKTKTPSLIGYPDENAVLNASRAKIFTDTNRLNDVFVGNLRWISSRQDVNNAHFIWAIGEVSRATWWNNTFSNHGPGIKGTDNPAGVFVSNTSHHKKYILYKNNVHEKFFNGIRNGSYVDIYYSSYVLIEQNIARDSDNKCGFWAKGTTSFVTIRANIASHNIKNGGICIGYGKESPEVPNNHEVAFNRIVFQRGKPTRTTLLFATERSYEGLTFNSFVYRNSFINGSALLRFLDASTTDIQANVVVSDKLDRWPYTPYKEDSRYYNLTGTEIDEITDSLGNLKGEKREIFYGKLGAEIVNVK